MPNTGYRACVALPKVSLQLDSMLKSINLCEACQLKFKYETLPIEHHLGTVCSFWIWIQPKLRPQFSVFDGS